MASGMDFFDQIVTMADQYWRHETYLQDKPTLESVLELLHHSESATKITGLIQAGGLLMEGQAGCLTPYIAAIQDSDYVVSTLAVLILSKFCLSEPLPIYFKLETAWVKYDHDAIGLRFALDDLGKRSSPEVRDLTEKLGMRLSENFARALVMHHQLMGSTATPPPAAPSSKPILPKFLYAILIGAVVFIGLAALAIRILLGPNPVQGAALPTSKPPASEITEAAISPAVATQLPRPAASGEVRERIAFFAGENENKDIFVMDADGSNSIQLTFEPAWDWSPTWSPDGRQIAFMSFRDNQADIYLMDADGKNVVRLTSDPFYEGFPAFSPDGNLLAFTSDQDELDPAGCGSRAAGCNSNIFIINISSKQVTRLTDHPGLDEDPSWSPDGKQIAFSSNRDGIDAIYTMDSDGTGVTRLSPNGSYNQHPAWSPDGQKIVFASDQDGNYEIYMINAEGSEIGRLTWNETVDLFPSWSPDGQHIAFHSIDSNGISSLCTMQADGSNTICLDTIFGSSYEPVWQPLTRVQE